MAGVVLVSNAATSGAIRDVYDETRTVLEAAGALAVAGARAYLRHNNVKVRLVNTASPNLPCPPPPFPGLLPARISIP